MVGFNTVSIKFVVSRSGKNVMDFSKTTSKIEALDKKLEEFKRKDGPIRSDSKSFRASNLGWRMIIELVVGMVLGISLGFGMDTLFGTNPLFLIIMALLGFAGGIRAMMKTAKEISD